MAIAPNERPTKPTATPMARTSRSSASTECSPDRTHVHYTERIAMSFVKTNEATVGANNGVSVADGAPPLAAIAAALRRERERAGLSLTELARRAGLAKSTLSQLESGTGNPSVETLWALGVALGVPFSQLVEPPAPQVRVVRAGEGAAIHSERAGLHRDPARRRAARTRGATST